MRREKIDTENPGLGVRSFNENGEKIVNSITDSILVSLDKIDLNLEDASISIRNELQGRSEGSVLSIDFKDGGSTSVDLTKEAEEFLYDVLKFSIRMPEPSRGSIEGYTAYSGWVNQDGIAWYK